MLNLAYFFHWPLSEIKKLSIFEYNTAVSFINEYNRKAKSQMRKHGRR